MKTVKQFILIISTMGLFSCSILTSSTTPITGGNKRDMLVYYLPKGALSITLTPDSSGQSQAVTMTAERVFFPDVSVPYYLYYSPNPLSDDQLDIELNDNGTLKSIGAIADDQTDEAITDLVAALGEVVTKMEVARETPDFKPKQFLLEPDCEPEPINGWIFSLRPKLHPCFSGRGNQGKQEGSSGSPGKSNQNTVNGVYYRPMAPYILEVKEKESDSTIFSQVVMLPSDESVSFVDIRRSIFVKKEYALVFDNGCPAKATVKKPSAVKAVASLPVDILKAIVSIPAQLVQLRINTAGNEKALSEALKAEAEAKQQLIDYLKEQQKKKETE